MKNEDGSNTNKNNNLDKKTDTCDSNIKKDYNLFLKDLAFFKNDILKELNNLEIKIDSQRRLNTDLRSKITSQDLKLSKIKDTLENVISLANDNEATTNYCKEKINKLIDFKIKNEDNYNSLDYKLRLNSEELKNAINKYDKIIYDFFNNPSVLGRVHKFKDFHELIDYIMNNIKIFSDFKDKNELDLKTYKVKLDTMIQSINLKIDGIMDKAKVFTLNNVTQLEKKCMDEIQNLDEKVMKIRVVNIELTKKIEKEKKEIFEEWENMKKSNKEMSVLFNLSLEKLNNNNTNIQKILDNYENQLHEIKENIASINELYNKIIKENNEYKNDYKNNSTKSEYFKSSSQLNEKNHGMKRIQSAKTILQKYIEGNTLYDELIENNNQKCNKHENSESSMQFMMKKFYDEGYNHFKDINIIETIGGKMNKNNSLNERVKMNRTMNPSPINRANSNHFTKKKNEILNKNEIKNSNRAVNKLRNNSTNKRIRLIKNVININNKRNKSKSKEADKKLFQPEFSENFLNKSRLTKLEILSNTSLLYDDDSKNNQFRKIESNEIHKNDVLFLKDGKNEKNFKNKMDKLKPKENTNISIIKNKHMNKPKAKKIKDRLNSSEIIKHNNINEVKKNILIYNIHANNQELLKDKKLVNFLNKRKNHEIMKKSMFNLKFKKNQ